MRADGAQHAGSGQGCRIGIAVLAVVLGGCATRVDVRPMATGRTDRVAYELNGSDLHILRSQAQRMCPLGGEILREAGHSLPPEAEAGRWRSTVSTLAAWAEPPRRPAQLVVVCRKSGDHDRLQAAVLPASTPQSATPLPDGAEALPVGPINPEW